MLDHQVGKVLLRIMFHALIAERSREFDTFSSSSCHPGGRHRWWPLLQALSAGGSPWHTYSRYKRRNRC